MSAPVTMGIPVTRPRRRGTELALLAFAIVLALCAQVAVELAHTQRVTSGLVGYAVALVGLFGAAHLAIRRFAPYADPLFLPLVALLNGIGLAMIARLDNASTDAARQLHLPLPRGDAPLQLVWTGVGIAGFILVLAILRDHRTLARYGYTAMFGGLTLLLLPVVLPARFSEVNGARSWIRVAGFSIQPSEVAKLALIVFFASYLVAKRQVLSVVTRSFLGLSIPRARDLGPVLVAWAVSMLVLARENDLGPALLFFGIFLAMLYVATERASWLVIGMGLFAVGSFAAYQLFAHVRERFVIWLHPFAGNNPTTISYQLVQGLFGFATGGVLGTGLGRGDPQVVPFARTDFIMAAIGEELGLVGVMAILVVYALLVSRGMRASLGVRDSFGKLLAAGLSASMALQVFVIVGGVMRLIPLTGITLPFVAYGGSSVLANYALVALLVRISDAGRRPETPPAPASGPTPGSTRDAPTRDAPTEVIRR
ncbi:MAG: FtsW/RodA/SpoVE family cell cycle protein [Mycobacteriales bacterium]